MSRIKVGDVVRSKAPITFYGVGVVIETGWDRMDLSYARVRFFLRPDQYDVFYMCYLEVVDDPDKD